MRHNMRHKWIAFTLIFFTFFTTTGFGLKDAIKDAKPDTDKCKNKDNESKCKDKERAKSAAKVIAVGIAAKIITDMVVEFKTNRIKEEKEVVQNYKKEHASLPKEATIVSYTTSLKPGQVIKPGKPVLLISRMEVIPGNTGAPLVVKEKIAIHDNDDNTQVIKSLTKNVNEKTKQGGIFENEFSFTLPVGMPQGVYPIKTAVILNDKEENKVDQSMQVVMQVFEDGRYTIAAN